MILGRIPDAVFNTAVYFKNTYKDDWITDNLSREMILDVDNSVVVGPHLIESPVLGAISPLQLSGGVKTLILISNVPDRIFNASTCGDNCAKWLLRLGDEKNSTINLRHLMDFGKGEFCLRIQNTDRIVHNMHELVLQAGDFVR